MSLEIRNWGDWPEDNAYDYWVVMGDDEACPLPEKKRLNTALALEAAFDATSSEWFGLGRELGSEKNGNLAHAPSCTANASALGVMLAWSKLAKDWVIEAPRVLAICPDPWLFRHLQTLSGIKSGKPPAIFAAEFKLKIRGWAARTVASLRFFQSYFKLRSQKAPSPGESYLLVYGHPKSDAQGNDAYFGDLMQKFPDLKRVLHVDCKVLRALELAQDGRTISLHGFGNPLEALLLPFACWRPVIRGQYAWLIRREAAIEGGTAQAAAIRWQHICVDGFLKASKPWQVAWPWEYHAWEREFVRQARKSGVRTHGYQHSVLGRHMLNCAHLSNPDGLASIPDKVICNGPSTRQQLLQWGMPEDLLPIGGAIRFPDVTPVSYAPTGLIFGALPFGSKTSVEMVAVIKKIAQQGKFSFVVKDHPMTPTPYEDSEGIKRIKEPLEKQENLAAVLYAATTVGLEAALMGLPVIRFVPRTFIALDILPRGIEVMVADGQSLAARLEELNLPSKIARDFVFGAIDLSLWQECLQCNLKTN